MAPYARDATPAQFASPSRLARGAWVGLASAITLLPTGCSGGSEQASGAGPAATITVTTTAPTSAPRATTAATPHSTPPSRTVLPRPARPKPLPPECRYLTPAEVARLAGLPTIPVADDINLGCWYMFPERARPGSAR